MKTESVNVAFLGNCTTSYISQALYEECERFGITASIYNCPYNQYNQEILNKGSGFYNSKPEITMLFLEGRLLFPDWYEFETLTEDSLKKTGFIQSELDLLTSTIENIHSNSSTKIVVNNFKIPYHSPLGILDGKYHPGLKNMIARLNYMLEEWASQREYVYVFDYTGLCAQFGTNNAEDPKMYYIAKNTVSFSFINILAREYMRYILPLKSKSKKCLVLDLDNTLWGGIAGEDGISGVNLDISGTGRSFYDFQKEIFALYQKGIILAINSKNNIEDAMAIINKHPHMILKQQHFSSIKINWKDKVQNLKDISQDLSIGIDSMVFFDDSPVERDFVKSMLPMVKVVDVPVDTSKYADTLKNIVEFEILKITDEDIKRNKMYDENRKRIESLQQYGNLEDYLKSLDTKVIVEYANEYSIPRIAQLTQKTNQFNLTTKRYTQDNIADMVSSQDHLVFSCKATDKFGDNGVVGVCIIELGNTCAYIDTFLLSCRVLGRNIEYAFISKIASILEGKGINTIYGRYIKTDKNRVNENFYLQSGFTKLSSDENETLYTLGNFSELCNIACIKVVLAEED